MWNDVRVLLLAALGLLVRPSVAVPLKKFNITVGYLPCIKGEMRDRQGLAISGALSMALEDINNSTELLPDVRLLLEWNDTKCDEVTATRLLTDMSCSGVVAFFGPEGRCHTEAIIAQSRNLPMIAYKCSDYQTSKLSTFARLEPPDTQATKSVISLLRYYRWNKFSIIYEESCVTVALTLKNYAKKNNMTVNHHMPVVNGYKCCEEKMSCCAPGFWYQFIQETKNRTRKTEVRGSSSQNTCQDTVDFHKRSQSLLVVVSSEPEDSYKYFTKRVRVYNSMKPFNFPPLPGDFKNKFNKYVSIYAAYLYDSVKLYATALHQVIKEETTYKNETLTYSKLNNIVTNGSYIVSKMILTTPFNSVSGMSIRLDDRADSEGNFSLLAFKPANYTDLEINCTYSMIPVGHFQQNTKLFPDFKLNSKLPIDWPDSVKPEDEPSCGFLNEKCPKDDSQI